MRIICVFQCEITSPASGLSFLLIVVVRLLNGLLNMWISPVVRAFIEVFNFVQKHRLGNEKIYSKFFAKPWSFFYPPSNNVIVNLSSNEVRRFTETDKFYTFYFFSYLPRFEFRLF